MFGPTHTQMVLLMLLANNTPQLIGTLPNLVNQDQNKSAMTVRDLHAQPTNHTGAISANPPVGLPHQTELTTLQATTLSLDKIKCKENCSRMDQLDVLSKQLISLINILEVSTLKFFQIQLSSTMLLLLLAGVKMQLQEKCTGLAETHGEHTGVKAASSR